MLRKNILLLILITISTALLRAQDESKIFFSLFPTESTPFATKGIGSGFYFEDKEYEPLPDSLSLIYICFNNEDKMYFSYTQEHMEDPTYGKKIVKKYQYYPVAKFVHKNFNIVLFPKSDPYREELHARVYSKKGEFIDSLVVNEYRSEQYHKNLMFKHSLIKNDSIITFTYINLFSPDMINSEEFEKLDKTKVIIDQYLIEDHGNFKLSESDTILLKSMITDFENNKSLAEDDPFKRFLEYKN